MMVTRLMMTMTMTGECNTSKAISRFARTSFCLPLKNLIRSRKCSWADYGDDNDDDEDDDYDLI